MINWMGAGTLAATLLWIGVAALPQSALASPGEQQSAPAAPNTLTFDGEVALWSVAINADRTADFERVMARLREGLLNSDRPERREQAKGWRIMRMERPLPDGSIAYVHVIDHVVPGADYTVMQILYDEFPDERQTLYEAYRGAFAKNLALTTGNVAVDMAAGIAPPPSAIASGR